MPSLISLAIDILVNASRLDESLSSEGLPVTSFEHDSLGSLPSDLDSTRKALIDATHSLTQLVQGPVANTVNILYSWTDFVSLRAIYEYKLPHAVPVDGSATYEEISSASGLSVSLVRRFLRHAMTNRLFLKTSPGHVGHTAASRMLATDPDFFDTVGLETAELGPAAVKVIDVLTKYGESGEQHETAYSIQNQTTLPIYQFLGGHPERARRFGAGMRFLTKGEGWNLKHLIAGFDWSSIDHPGSTVVDVGGGQGSVSCVLARASHHIKFVVQDLPGTAEQGRAALPADLEGRVDFVAHDFFSEQDLKGAEVYLFRWIMHNWSDKYCIKVLQQLIPALRLGNRVILYEYVLKDGEETRLTEKAGLDFDMIMATCFNGSERTSLEWVDLFKRADERFVIKNIVRPKGSTMSVIEVVWETGGED